MPALLRMLQREAACDAGIVLWFDAHGEVSNLYAPNLPAPTALATWFAPVYGAGQVVRLSMQPASKMHRSSPITTCADGDDVAPARDDPGPAPACPNRHLCSKVAPDGVARQRLCCAVKRQGSPIASLMVYRAAAMSSFASSERVAVKAAGRYLSLNGRTLPAETDAAMYRAAGEQGFLDCEPDGRVIRASANGYELLAQACGCPVNRSTVPGPLEHCGRQLIRRVLAAGDDLGGHSPTAGVRRMISLINAWGLFRLHAFFDGDAPLGVLVERVEHLLVRLVEAMEGLDLSVQQGEALLLLAQGLSQDQIAERMGVTHNTADYHIRQLYSKLDAHTRNEAIACALGALESARAAPGP